ncbi:hypothetical protein EU508_04660 [Pseudoalteromonas fuliginea]|uniref:Uncharacterized protein n=1 Tax=Pseudoalteromonas fuliginea TaxID=1872678 RepID=A0AB73BK56_9GAMM|nr:hypothetical protein [Pseudoalteromonas fuliginea]KAA1163480.1 hypothetical protein EU508_04660 [Pseudoalteromonas fuliginea]
MEQAAVIEIIIKTLDRFFASSFKEAQLSTRHYDFTSQHYDFSFPSTIASGLTEQRLQNRVENFLKHHSAVIDKNNHYLFDESGNIRTS